MQAFKSSAVRAVVALAIALSYVTSNATPASASWSATGDITFAGTAELPVFPCTGTCNGTFQGTWTAHVSGHNETAAYTVDVQTVANRINALFSYSESFCAGPGGGAVTGQANGHFVAQAFNANAESFGLWHQVGETFPRSIVEVRLEGYFEWLRAGNSAAISAQPTWLNLYVQGLGWRQIAAVIQRGVATFAPTHSDAPPTGVVSCSSPLTNVQGEISGNLPITDPTV